MARSSSDSYLKNPINSETFSNIISRIRMKGFHYDGKEGNELDASAVYLIDPTASPVNVKPNLSYVYRDGTTQEVQRTMTQFKNWLGKTAAGPSAVWTPATGKKFRLMGFMVSFAKDTTCAAGLAINLLDNATVIWGATISSAALAAPGTCQVFVVNLPNNGYLSSTANNALNVALSAALTAGSYDVVAWGCEE